jgi:hypothetical protein
LPFCSSFIIVLFRSWGAAAGDAGCGGQNEETHEQKRKEAPMSSSRFVGDFAALTLFFAAGYLWLVALG